MRTTFRAAGAVESREGGASAGGPLIVSITSEDDDATGSAFPFGRSIQKLGTSFRRDHAPGAPSQSHLVRHAEGHVDALLSHRARVVDGEVVLEPVEGSTNATPF